jgi:hypothetical protein
MFEAQFLLGDTERSIVVQTRTGKPIPNDIAAEPTERDIRVRAAIREKHGRGWIPRKPECGVYNCAGLTWASRRTAIRADEHWDLIFKEDGYRKFTPSEEPPRPGDLVVYREKDIGYLHVGLILACENLGEVITPRLLSKWDDASGEYFHWVNDTPFYHQKDWVVTFEYWTDRPFPQRLVTGK